VYGCRVPGALRFLLGLALFALAPKLTAAEPVRVALVWHAPSGGVDCLTPSSLAQRVETQLGHPVFVAPGSPAADVELAVDVSSGGAQGREMQVELELRRRGESLGGRSLQGSADNCTALLDSLVVVVALLVDVPREDEPKATPIAPAQPAPIPSLVAPPPSAPRRSPKQLSFDAHSTWVSGLEPGLAGGFGLATRFAFAVAPALALRLSADYLPRDRLTTPDGRVSFNAGVLQLGVAPVRLGSPRSFIVEPWVFGTVTAMHARGQGFGNDRAGVRWLAGAGLALRASLPLYGRWALTGGAGLSLALARPQFLYRDASGVEHELQRPDFLLPNADLGASFRFW
jgi:hypothetical protein